MDQRTYGFRCVPIYSRVNCTFVRNVGKIKISLGKTDCNDNDIISYKFVLKVYSKK